MFGLSPDISSFGHPWSTPLCLLILLVRLQLIRAVLYRGVMLICGIDHSVAGFGSGSVILFRLHDGTSKLLIRHLVPNDFIVRSVPDISRCVADMYVTTVPLSFTPFRVCPPCIFCDDRMRTCWNGLRLSIFTSRGERRIADDWRGNSPGDQWMGLSGELFRGSSARDAGWSS